MRDAPRIEAGTAETARLGSREPGRRRAARRPPTAKIILECYTWCMLKVLEDAVAALAALDRDDQERVAHVLAAWLNGASEADWAN